MQYTNTVKSSKKLRNEMHWKYHERKRRFRHFLVTFEKGGIFFFDICHLALSNKNGRCIIPRRLATHTIALWYSLKR